MQSVSVWGFYAPLLGGVLLLAYLLSYVQPAPSETDISTRPLRAHVAAERTVAASEQHIAGQPSGGTPQRAPATAVAPGAGTTVGPERAQPDGTQN